MDRHLDVSGSMHREPPVVDGGPVDVVRVRVPQVPPFRHALEPGSRARWAADKLLRRLDRRISRLNRSLVWLFDFPTDPRLRAAIRIAEKMDALDVRRCRIRQLLKSGFRSTPNPQPQANA